MAVAGGTALASVPLRPNLRTVSAERVHATRKTTRSLAPSWRAGCVRSLLDTRPTPMAMAVDHPRTADPAKEDGRPNRVYHMAVQSSLPYYRNVVLQRATCRRIGRGVYQLLISGQSFLHEGRRRPLRTISEPPVLWRGLCIALHRRQSGPGRNPLSTCRTALCHP